MSNRSIEGQLRLSQIVIGNALANPTLLATLAEYGYTTNRLQQGNALREQAWALYHEQKAQYSELSAANGDLVSIRQQARTTYLGYVRMARLVFSDNRGASQKLDLAGERKGPLTKWLAQAQQFYTHTLSDTAILDKLTAVGITRAMLEAGQRELDTVGASEETRRQQRGAARDATRERDEALAALDARMQSFTNIAREAFKGRPQLLDKLGIKARKARSATGTRSSATRSAVAFGVEASTLTHNNDHPAPEYVNGRAPVSTP